MCTCWIGQVDLWCWCNCQHMGVFAAVLAVDLILCINSFIKTMLPCWLSSDGLFIVVHSMYMLYIVLFLKSPNNTLLRYDIHTVFARVIHLADMDKLFLLCLILMASTFYLPFPQRLHSWINKANSPVGYSQVESLLHSVFTFTGYCWQAVLLTT